ncbi:MAG: FliM/FliN family flagellar motor switch protein [Planctomycetota bacterium]|jgi:flagellar motor switch protein FliM
MSSTVTQNLGREKMQQILASIGSQKVNESDQVEAAEYNWHQPHCFSNDQLKKLDNFTEKVAQSCAEKFAQLYNSDFNVTINLTTQHFANELIASNNNQSDCYLTFNSDPGQPFGLVGIPDQTAIVWATQLLGDTNSAENSDRDLSKLEESLLFDIACGIVKAFSDSFENYDLSPGSEIVRGQIPIELNGTEELCKITFNFKKTDSENSSEAYFLILCDKLKPVVGQNVQAGEDSSSETLAKAMLNHVHKLPVSITTRLASTVLTLEDMMNLHVDDVLLFDKKLNEPVELIIEGQTIFRGQPAKSDGNHAVVITELFGTE